MTDDQWVARRDREDADERDRWAQAYRDADLTPRANGRWTMRSIWNEHGACSEADISTSHDTYQQAVVAGRRTACCSGVQQLWIYGPDGVVHHTCDTEHNNYWLNHTDIARAHLH